MSRKLESESERGRLKKIGEDIRRPGEGLIVRTLAKGASRQDLEQDLNALRNTWSDIMRLEKFSSAPCEVYRDLDMALRWVRDLLTEEVDDLWVDDPKTADTILRFVKQLMPDLSDRIKLYEGKEPLFRHFGLEEEIEKMFASKIWLKNGGYLVVDHTEALTVIDVNTGKYTGTSDPEETMFRTNLEAAEEIGRLIRLRDIGGIIIADFIDMDSREYRDRIVKTLQESMKKDRTRSVVVGWTRLGLLEITRKKVRENMKNQITETMPRCGGSGRVPKESS